MIRCRRASSSDAAPRPRLVVVRDGSGRRERGAADLVASAHGEEHGSTIQGGEQSAICLELAHSGDLGGVLAAAEQVEVCVRGDRLAGLDHQQFGVQATPLETFLAHHGIAVIAVDAQQ